MHRLIAGSKLVIFPQSGHMNFVDQPALFNKTIAGFLTQ
jgi:pimeloyl-ACP methyl ester carboxylesterase